MIYGRGLHLSDTFAYRSAHNNLFVLLRVIHKLKNEWMNEDLLNNSKWLIANKLTLNMTRTELMLIGSRQKLNTLTASPVLSINGTLVNQVSLSKFLGVLIDANLNWGSHIEKLAKKIPSGIAAINW